MTSHNLATPFYTLGLHDWIIKNKVVDILQFAPRVYNFASVSRKWSQRSQKNLLQLFVVIFNFIGW